MADTPQDVADWRRGGDYLFATPSFRDAAMIIAVAIESPVLPPHRGAPESPRTI